MQYLHTEGWCLHGNPTLLGILCSFTQASMYLPTLPTQRDITLPPLKAETVDGVHSHRFSTIGETTSSEQYRHIAILIVSK